jgi:hypothetical protein
MMCDILKGSIYFRGNENLMDYMVSLHFIDFISWGVFDTAPLEFVLHFALRYSKSFPVWPLDGADCKNEPPYIHFPLFYK